MAKRRGASFTEALGNMARKSLLIVVGMGVLAALGGSGYLYFRRPATDRQLKDLVAEEKGLYHKAIQGLPGDFQSVRRDGSMPDVIGVEVARVANVLSGNAIEVTIDGDKEQVRLLRVDPPGGGPKAGGLAQEAVDYARTRLEGTQVRLVSEPGAEPRDARGRRLAYVFLDGENINVELVRKGLSPYDASEGTSQEYDADFRSAERDARDARRGIWADPELTQVYLNRRSTSARKSSEVAAHTR